MTNNNSRIVTSAIAIASSVCMPEIRLFYYEKYVSVLMITILCCVYDTFPYEPKKNEKPPETRVIIICIEYDDAMLSFERHCNNEIRME